jgi:hypothetical protein
VLISSLIERCGAANVAGFGRLMVANLKQRDEAAKAAGIAKPTFVLCDHEFAAVVFFLVSNTSVGPHGPTTPEALVSEAMDTGILHLGDTAVIHEGRALAEMRDQAEAKAAGKMGFN